MLLINGLTNDAFQQFILDGIPGVSITVLLSYRPRVQQWYMDITYGTFQVQGIAVVNSPNLLRQWKNTLPFGIACTYNYPNLDPYQQNDFANQIANLYLLNSTDIANIEAEIYS